MPNSGILAIHIARPDTPSAATVIWRPTVFMLHCSRNGTIASVEPRYYVGSLSPQLCSLDRDRILAIARRHGVTNVKVFGSFARGDAGPHSDLDLLIEAGPHTTPFFPGGLIADLEEALGRRVDDVEEQGLHRLLRDRIHAEAIAL